MGAQGTGLGLDPTSELQLHRGMFSTWSPSDFTHAFTTHPRKYTCRPPVRTEPEGKKGTKASASQIALAITGVGEGTHWHAVVRAEPTRQC